MLASNPTRTWSTSRPLLLRGERLLPASRVGHTQRDLSPHKETPTLKPLGRSFSPVTANTPGRLHDSRKPSFRECDIAGNSTHCIKTAASKGQDCDRGSRCSSLASFLPFYSKRLVLPSLRLVAICNVSRILMQIAAYLGRASSRESPNNPSCRRLRE